MIRVNREEEGRDLLGKRTMDFKVSYLDAGLTNSYFSDSDSLGASSCMGSAQLTSQQPQSQSQQQSSPQPQAQRVNRRYKTQLRDFLSTCRSKRASKLGKIVVHQLRLIIKLSPPSFPKKSDNHLVLHQRRDNSSNSSRRRSCRRSHRRAPRPSWSPGSVWVWVSRPWTTSRPTVTLRRRRRRRWWRPRPTATSTACTPGQRRTRRRPLRLATRLSPPTSATPVPTTTRASIPLRLSITGEPSLYCNLGCHEISGDKHKIHCPFGNFNWTVVIVRYIARILLGGGRGGAVVRYINFIRSLSGGYVLEQ